MLHRQYFVQIILIFSVGIHETVQETRNTEMNS